MNRVQNFEAKREIAHDEQISPFATKFSKVVCCRCVGMPLKVGGKDSQSGFIQSLSYQCLLSVLYEDRSDKLIQSIHWYLVHDNG